MATGRQVQARWRRILARVAGIGLVLLLLDHLIGTLSFGALERFFGVYPGFRGIDHHVTGWTKICLVICVLASLFAGTLIALPVRNRRMWRLLVGVAVLAIALSPFTLVGVSELSAYCGQAYSMGVLGALWFSTGAMLTWQGKLPPAIDRSPVARMALLVFLGLFCVGIGIMVGIMEVWWYGFRAPPGGT